MKFAKSIKVNVTVALLYNIGLLFLMFLQNRDVLIFSGLLILFGGAHLCVLLMGLVYNLIKEKPTGSICYKFGLVLLIYIVNWVVIINIF